ncbi:hypothetical protein PVAP13_3NG007080 [Panicum virgatum]|uniref:Uncharacterized protein n=1 Tax=Panicum virgatum TaxID=38727 RepID=A0A8T0U0U6_PANVG|nr:hypothetical protein PVAP13_3NG007080 [Panicum virgatum]
MASIARGHPEDAVNSNSNKKTLSIVAAVVAEKQFQAILHWRSQRRGFHFVDRVEQLTQLQSHSRN